MRLQPGFLTGFGLGVCAFGEDFGNCFQFLDLTGKKSCFLLLHSASFCEISHNFKEIQESGLFILEWGEIGSLNQCISSKLDRIRD